MDELTKKLADIEAVEGGEDSFISLQHLSSHVRNSRKALLGELLIQATRDHVIRWAVLEDETAAVVAAGPLMLLMQMLRTGVDRYQNPAHTFRLSILKNGTFWFSEESYHAPIDYDTDSRIL